MITLVVYFASEPWIVDMVCCLTYSPPLKFKWELTMHAPFLFEVVHALK
jgi:hypothetical protein